MLSLQNATLAYGRRVVLQSIGFRVERGQWVSLLGPNGAGKSTLMKACLGVLRLSSGTRECTAARLGYVPQKFNLPPDHALTVEEFLDLKPLPRGADLAALHSKTLSDLKLSDLLKAPLRSLSGGQLQRALLAFALWNDPEILFLDEYADGIDFEVRDAVTAYLASLHRERGLTVLEVSHDITSVVRAADRVVLLKGGILFDGSPNDQGFHECLHSVYSHHHWSLHD